MTTAFIPGFTGSGEVLLVLVVILLLFGSKRLPELARSLGKSLNEFKRGRQEGERENTKPDADTPPAGSSSKPDSDTPAGQGPAARQP